MTRLVAVLVTLAGVIGLSCAGSSEREIQMIEGGRVLKIAVFSDGRITADGSPTTVDSLRESLKRLAAEHGQVWYYREAAQAEPPPQAMAVLQAVIDNRLPVRLSTKPDYSDSVGPDGRPH